MKIKLFLLFGVLISMISCTCDNSVEFNKSKTGNSNEVPKVIQGPDNYADVEVQFEFEVDSVRVYSCYKKNTFYILLARDLKTGNFTIIDN